MRLWFRSLTASLAGCALASAPAPAAAAVRFTIDTRAPVRTFAPEKVFGVALDGGDAGESAPLLSPRNGRALRSLGATHGTYRLRTELAGQAWHWSQFGQWSDLAHDQGYWTGSDDRDDPSPVSFGYRLPRRGDTHDEADDNGYSRLVDGDDATFWKSNPYLDARYTGVAGERAEWIKLDLGKLEPVQALEIRWGEPFATRYAVDYWDGPDPQNGRWTPFAGGEVLDGRGGVDRRRLADQPVLSRYVRLRLLTSSHTAPQGANDPRDALGYAVRELRLSRVGPDGALIDVLRHSPTATGQSEAVVSSTDPWHRAIDRDPDTEQPSPLAIAGSELLHGGGLMLPVGVLYDTPENALAELRYFRRRGLPIESVELGEEPDGQRILPADYALLYSETARALHGEQADLSIGGPSLVNGFADTWLEDGPNRSWTQGFWRALEGSGASDQLAFYSVEHYSIDDLCGPASSPLGQEPALMAALFQRLAADGLPAGLPKVVSKDGLSSYSGRMEVEPAGGVFTALAGASFLKAGGGVA